MKYQLTSQFANVRVFEVKEHILFMLIGGKIEYHDLVNLQNGSIKYNDEIDIIYFSLGKIYFKSKNSLYEINNQFGINKAIKISGESFVPINSNVFLVYDLIEQDDLLSTALKYMLVKDNSIVSEAIKDKPMIALRENIFIEKNIDKATEIGRYDFYNLKILWTYHLPPLMHTYGRFYLVDQVLIFRTNTAHLIGLDIETGKELWRLEKCNRAFHILEEQQKMFSLQTNRYQVIDPIKGEKVIEKRFEDIEEKLNIWPSPHLANVYPEGLYFVSNYQGTRFGMVDIYNSEIAWVQDHNPEAGRYEGLAAPVLHQDKLYLHEAGKTLYVYERV